MLSLKQLEFLNATYSKDKLQADWFPLVKKFVFANRTTQFEGVNLDEIVKLIQSKNSFNKQELMLICFVVLIDETIFKAFVASLPPYMPEIIERLLWEDNMGKLEAEEITSADLLLSQGSSYYSEVYKALPGLGLLHVAVQNRGYFSFSRKPWEDRYKELDIFLSIPPALKNIIIHFYPKPEGYNIKPVTAPEHPGIKIFDVEATIAPEVLRSTAYYQQGNIKYSTKGKPNPGGMNKMQRQLGIAEFFTNKEFSTSRTLLIAGLLYGYKSKNMQADAVAIIKKLFTENYINAGGYFAPVAPYILTQIKGINYADEGDYKSSANKEILEILKALPVDQWVTAENLLTYIKTRSIDIRPINDWKINNSIFYESEKNQYGATQRRYITQNNVSRIIDLPYFKGNLFLFAAFGLLAISYIETDTTGEHGKDWYSEYDGLQAVKLTHLGAYVLGLEKEYKSITSEPAGKLVFDEHALIVRAEGDMQLVDMIIGNYLEKLSATRYTFNTAYFLKDCYAADDIKNKISIFKQAAGTPLPPFWEAHLQLLVDNTKAINKESDVVVFQLSSTNKDLQQLIVQDPVIKKLVLKAELFHILVSKDNLHKFKSRMKELGYVV